MKVSIFYGLHKIDAIDKGRLGQYASDLLTSVPSLAFIGPRKKKINYELFGRKIDSQ